MRLKTEELITKARESRGSDVHLACGVPPKVRVDGRLQNLTDEPLTRGDCEE